MGQGKAEQLNAYIRAQRKSLSSVERLKVNDRVEEDFPAYGLFRDAKSSRRRTRNTGRTIGNRQSSSQQPVASSRNRAKGQKR